MAQQSNDSNNIPSSSPPKDLVKESRATFIGQGSDSSSADSLAAANTRVSLPDKRAAENFGFHVHKYIAEFIRLADQKAAFVFALNTGLLCYGFNAGVCHMWLKEFNSWTVLDLFCFVAMTMLVFGLFFSYGVIMPNLHKSHRGFVFFGSIAEYESATAYSSDILSTVPAQLSRAILQHSYDISKICTSKYRKLGFALRFTIIGIIAFVIVLLLRP